MNARCSRRRVPLALLFVLLVVPLVAAAAGSGTTVRVSVNSLWRQGIGGSLLPALSADGRFIAFYSYASNLVAGDTNGYSDIFVRDLQTGETSRVSLSSAGQQANGNSYAAALSADGRVVAFESLATNLVAGDTNGYSDIFVRDLQTGETSRVSLSSAGEQGNGGKLNPALSADGRVVAFQSLATNLVPGDTNGAYDVFVRDLQSGTTTRVSVTSAGEQGNDNSYAPALSADGRVVAFYSYASNLVPGNTNRRPDVFVRDLQSGTTTRVSVTSAGVQGNGGSFNPALSADGRVVAFESLATNLVAGDTNGQEDIFVRDLQTGTTSRVSLSSAGQQANGNSYAAALSADGRVVAFYSDASNLVAGDTNGARDVFVRDLQTGQTTRVSVDSAGVQGNGASYSPALSADGRFIAFASDASNLVAGDTNAAPDVFVHDTLGVPAPNLVFNGGFERDANADGQPDGWSSNSYTSRTTTLPHSGDYALRLQANDPASFFAVVQPVANLQAGMDYALAGWVNIPAAGPGFTLRWIVQWRDATDAVLATDVILTYTAPTSGWSFATRPVVAPAGTTHAVVGLTVNQLNGTIYVDDVTFQAGSP